MRPQPERGGQRWPRHRPRRGQRAPRAIWKHESRSEGHLSSSARPGLMLGRLPEDVGGRGQSLTLPCRKGPCALCAPRAALPGGDSETEPTPLLPVLPLRSCTEPRTPSAGAKENTAVEGRERKAAAPRTVRGESRAVRAAPRRCCRGAGRVRVSTGRGLKSSSAPGTVGVVFLQLHPDAAACACQEEKRSLM